MKTGIATVIFLFISLVAHSQTSLSFLHLGNSTFQNRFQNPAYVPEGKFFIGLPVLSGVHINYNNVANYNDVARNDGKTTEIDLNSFLRSLRENNMISIGTGINLFHFGLTSRSGMSFSVFVNERIEMDFFFPKPFMEFLIKGNKHLAGEKISIGETRFSSQHYREYGLGLTRRLSSDKLSVGINLKYLQGIWNASTKRNFTADLEFDPVDYSVSLDMRNASFKTSGIAIMREQRGNRTAHLLRNQNRGMAIDMGVDIQINKSYSIAGSLIDLGLISWKEDIQTHSITDTSMYYDGLNLKGVLSGDLSLEEVIKDSIIQKFKKKKTENDDSYQTMLAPKTYVSGVYNIPRAGEVVATVGARFIQGQMNLLLGAGYRQRFWKIFTGTINVTRLPQQSLNVGGALTVNAGPSQLYLAVDQLVNYDATKFQSADFRFGINLILREKNKANLPGREVKRASNSFLRSKRACERKRRYLQDR